MRSCRRALTLLLWVLTAVPAARAEWSERRPEDVSRFSLKKIEFVGDYIVSEGEIRNAIRSSTSGLLRFRPVDLDKVEGDVIRIRNFFRRRGYWNVKVDRTITFDHEKGDTRVVFGIDAGVQRKAGAIRVEGQQTFTADEILSWTKLRTGDPLDLGLTANDRTAIENEYANRGFFKVSVTADIQRPRESSAPREESGPRLILPPEQEAEPEPAGPEPKPGPIVHDLVFRVLEGPRFIVGTIDVEGNQFTDENTIRRELTIRTGEVLNREQVQESRARLYSTGYFSRVILEPLTDEARQGRVDVVVRVVERKMRFVGLGVGYGTQDQLRLSGEWGHRNVFGRAKRATVRGIVATELFPTDLVRIRLEGRYVEPWLFNTRTTGTGEVFFERTQEFIFLPDDDPEDPAREYELDLRGLVLNVNRSLTRHTRLWVSLENEWANADATFDPPPALQLRLNVTRTFALTLERDRRDDFFSPQKGFLNRIAGSVSGGILGGDNDFWRIVGETNWFRKTWGVVWAGRLRIGYERPYGKTAVIPDRERFKLGGANTVRGYEEREQELTIGPGDFMVLGNVEARFPLFWIVRGGIFLDGGNAWDSPADVQLRDFRPTASRDDPGIAREQEFRYSTGIGIRVATPVGPVRLDVAQKLKTVQKGEKDWNLHLSLGHVF